MLPSALVKRRLCTLLPRVWPTLSLHAPGVHCRLAVWATLPRPLQSASQDKEHVTGQHHKARGHSPVHPQRRAWHRAGAVGGSTDPADELGVPVEGVYSKMIKCSTRRCSCSAWHLPESASGAHCCTHLQARVRCGPAACTDCSCLLPSPSRSSLLELRKEYVATFCTF